MAITIAHQGDPANHWGNTLEAFESAAVLGADMVELDCKLTRDGHVVVLHDRTLARPWGIPRAVSALTWEEVSATRRHGYRVPRLAEVLDLVHLPVMVDVPSADVGEASLAVVEAAKAMARCMFAGSTGALVRMRQLTPAARIALSWDKRQLPPAELLANTRPEWFNPYFRLVTPRVVEQMHTAGLGVSAWTVDHRWDIRRVLRAGVDAIITNRTARLVSLLKTHRRKHSSARLHPSRHSDQSPSGQ